jgi:transglutaminase-like putative cysteine protease
MKTAALFFLVLVLAATVGWLQQLPAAASAQEQLYTLKNLRQYQVQYTHTLVNTSTSPIARQDIWIPIPVGDLNQRVLNVAFNPQPTEFLADNWGQQVAHYVVTDMAGGSSLDIGWTAEIQISEISFYIDPTVSLDDIPAEIITTYTADDERFLITDPVVVAAAAAAIGSETTLCGRVESIYQYVIDHLSFLLEGSADNAPTVLARGTGSCSEYCYVMMALLRANGIPCRMVGGTRNRSGTGSGTGDDYTDTFGHRAVDVYLPNHGWVPVDARLGDSRRQPIFTRSNDHFIFQMSGGRSSLLRWNYLSRLKVANTTTVTRSAQWTVSEITLDRPPAVTTNDAVRVAASSATLNGNLTAMGSAAGVAVSFEYGPAPGVYPGETARESKTAAWAFSSSLDGLSPGVTYYYRAKAVGNGTVYGTAKSFTTGTTPPAVTTGDATDVTADSAWLNGDLTSMGTENSATVSFAWGPTSGSYPKETAGQAMAGTGTYFCNLGSLTPGTTYYYKARAVGHGTSYGIDKSFTTATTPPAVTTGDASDITTTSARLNGDLTSLGTDGGASVSFLWGTRSGTYPNETAGQAMSSMGVFYSDLDSLSPGTTCYYKAKAVGRGEPVYGTEKSLTTLPRPRVLNLHPYSGERSQHLTVTISGADFDGATHVDFGSGIAVEDFNVNGNTEITVQIAIDADAAQGPRDVSVATPRGTATLTDAFTVGEETSSGGVPVWIWPIVGVAVVAAGAGGFFLFRGGELSPARLRSD